MPGGCKWPNRGRHLIRNGEHEWKRGRRIPLDKQTLMEPRPLYRGAEAGSYVQGGVVTR